MNQKEASTKSTQWQGSTDGLPFMQQSLIWMLRWIPIRIIYGIMSIVALFYMLFSRKNYLSIKHFYQKRFGLRGWECLKKCYQTHYQFGQVVIDKFAIFAGRKFKVEVENNHYFSELNEAEGGFMMVNSHFGNSEIAGFSLQAKVKKIYAIAFAGEKEVIMRNRSKILKQNNIELVPILPDMSHLFTLNNALIDGNIVSMAADRVFGSPKTVLCPFFGQEAKFPLGPFAIAAQRDVPLLSIFVVKQGFMSYKVFVNRIDTLCEETSPRAKMNSYAKIYASQLETLVKQYPSQWFNFYEFWD